MTTRSPEKLVRPSAQSRIEELRSFAKAITPPVGWHQKAYLADRQGSVFIECSYRPFISFLDQTLSFTSVDLATFQLFSDESLLNIDVKLYEHGCWFLCLYFHLDKRIPAFDAAQAELRALFNCPVNIEHPGSPPDTYYGVSYADNEEPFSNVWAYEPYCYPADDPTRHYALPLRLTILDNQPA